MQDRKSAPHHTWIKSQSFAGKKNIRFMRQLSDKSSVVNFFYFALVSFETFVFEGRGVCVSVEVFQFNGTTSQGI